MEFTNSYKPSSLASRSRGLYEMTKSRNYFFILILVLNAFDCVPAHANAECPASAAWPCVNSVIKSNTTPPSSGGGGSIKYLRLSF